MQNNAARGDNLSNKCLINEALSQRTENNESVLWVANSPSGYVRQSIAMLREKIFPSMHCKEKHQILDCLSAVIDRPIWIAMRLWNGPTFCFITCAKDVMFSVSVCQMNFVSILTINVTRKVDEILSRSRKKFINGTVRPCWSYVPS